MSDLKQPPSPRAALNIILNGHGATCGSYALSCKKCEREHEAVLVLRALIEASEAVTAEPEQTAADRAAWDAMCDQFGAWLIKDSENHGGKPGELPYMSNRALCWIQLEAPGVLAGLVAASPDRCPAQQDSKAVVVTASTGVTSGVAPSRGEESGRLTFEEVWAQKEREGYSYGEDALEQVRFGWELAQQALAAVPAEPEQAGKAQGWIPVEERLPEDGLMVLFWHQDWPANSGANIIGLGRFTRDVEGDWWEDISEQDMCGDSTIHYSGVTHWMPLPAPPTKNPTNG